MPLFGMPNRNLRVLIAIATVLSSSPAFAKKKKKKKKPSWSYEQTYRSLGTVQEGAVGRELVNPQNQFYQLPNRTLLLEFRPEIKGSYKRYKLVLRPRGTIQDDFRKIPALVPAPTGYVEPKSQTITSDVFFNEAYFAGTPNGQWQYVLGLQNFQWGPAELASPSNPIFRDLGLNKTYFFETRGKGLLRANYSPTGQTSVIVIAEAFDNGLQRNASEPLFQQKALVKGEWADASQTNYVGLVLSGAKDDAVQYGSYAHYEAVAGLTLYYDAHISQGTRLWAATFADQSLVYKQPLIRDSRNQSASLAGLRYVTEGNIDIRLEGFYETSAWTTQQRDLAKAVLAAAPTRDNANIYLNPGSFFPGQKYAYTSVRIPDFGPKNAYTLALRDLYSLTDATQSAQASLDSYIGDSLLVSSGITYAFGKADGELTQGYAWRAFLTMAWTL